MSEPTGVTALQDYAARFFALFVAYTVLAYLGLNWAVIGGAGSPVWPATGAALAGLVLGGIRLWPAIALGRLLAAILSGSQQPLWADVLIGAGNALAAVTSILLIRHLGSINPRLQSLTDMIRYLIFGALPASVLAAAIGTAVLTTSSGLQAEPARQLLIDMTIGNFVGASTIGPLILTWSHGGGRCQARRLIGLLALLAAIGALSFAVFTTPHAQGLQAWHLLPLLVLVSLAFDGPGAAAALVLVSAIAIWATGEGLGPFVEAADAPLSKYPQLQQFMATIAITVLLLSVVAHERRAKDAIEARENLLRAIEKEVRAALKNARIAEEQARKSAEEFEAVLNAVPAAIWVARDPDCKEILGNKLAGELLRLPSSSTNMSKSAEQGNDVAHFTFFDASGRELRPEELPVQRAARGEVIRDFEERLVFDDGSGRELLGAATPLFDRRGKVRGAVAAFIDITDRKAAEDRERLLSREVDHRAKNIMAVVQAIVQLTPASDVGSFRSAVEGRIRSLARTHGLLAENRWNGAELHKLILEELSPYLPSQEEPRAQTAVHITGPEVTLPPEMAQSLALVFHELATNAAKYGSLSVPAGRVFAEWEIADSKPLKMLQLVWEELGGPPVVAPEQKGFGLYLIKKAMEHQLGGKLKWHWSEEGLRVEIAVPLGDPIRVNRQETLSHSNSFSDATAAVGRPTVLVVEDEPLIAMLLEAELVNAGYEVLGPACSVAEAFGLLGERRPDAALLDVNLRGEKSFPIAEVLQSEGVPFAFCTGFTEESEIPERMRGTTRLSKPIPQEDIRRALAALVAGSMSYRA